MSTATWVTGQDAMDKVKIGLSTEQLSLIFKRELPVLSPDDIYQNANQDLLAKLDEDRRIERKPANTHGRKLGEYFSMWANTAPEGGLLVLGMENDGLFTGCSAAPFQSPGLRDQVFDLTLPLDQVAEGYRAMDERRAIKTLLRP
jgi:hypothetical protein